MLLPQSNSEETMSRALTNVSVMSQTMSDTSKNTFNSGNEF